MIHLLSLTRNIAIGLGVAVSILSGTGCSHAVSADKKAPATEPSDPMEVRASASLMERLTVGEPKTAHVGESITVAARVEVDDGRVARVGSPVMGRVTQLEVREGQVIRRGDLIAIVNSTALSDAQLSLLKALSQEQLARRAVDRAEILLASGVIGSAELRRREAELTQDASDVAASRDQLRVLGMPDDMLARLESTRTINSLLRINATMDGTVLQRKIAVGQVIEPADTLIEIADLSSLWLIADVPEESAGSLVAGESVEAEVAALPGTKIRGKISFVSATVSPETRTVRVRMDLPNPNRHYKPAMMATMVIHDPAQTRQVIPAAAVVHDGNQELVFVRRSADRFELRPVTLGAEYRGFRVLLDGLHPGEKIVISGAFHLNNERIRLSVQGA